MGTEFHEASAESHSSEQGEQSLARVKSPKVESTKPEQSEENEVKIPVEQNDSPMPKPSIQISSDYLERVKTPKQNAQKFTKPNQKSFSKNKNQKPASKNNKPDVWKTAQNLQQDNQKKVAEDISSAIESAFTKQAEPQSAKPNDSSSIEPGQTYQL